MTCDRQVAPAPVAHQRSALSHTSRIVIITTYMWKYGHNNRYLVIIMTMMHVTVSAHCVRLLHHSLCSNCTQLTAKMRAHQTQCSRCRQARSGSIVLEARNSNALATPKAATGWVSNVRRRGKAVIVAGQILLLNSALVAADTTSKVGLDR